MVDHNVISSHHVTRQVSLSSKAKAELSAVVHNIQFEQKMIRPSNHKTQVNDPCLLVQHTNTHTRTHSQDATDISVTGDNTCRSRAQMSLTNRPCRSVANCTQYPTTVKRDHPITCLRHTPSIHAKQGRIFQTVSPNNNSGNTFKLNTKTFC